MTVRREFTDEQLAKCADREVGQRRRVYQNLVASGKMSADKAASEIAMMMEIHDIFAARAEEQRRKSDLFGGSA